jgi:anti-anti-sigma factor
VGLFTETRTTDGTAAVISMIGKLGHESATTLREQLVEAMDGGSGDVIVEFDRPELVDATPLGVLLGASNRMRQNGRKLCVVADDEAFLSILSVMGLDRVFDVSRSRGDCARGTEAELPWRPGDPERRRAERRTGWTDGLPDRRRDRTAVLTAALAAQAGHERRVQ